MSNVPEDVAELVRQRTEARAARDFALADDLRDRIAARGFIVRDTPQGAAVEPQRSAALTDPSRIDNRLDEEPTLRFSLHLLYEGFRDDLARFLASFTAHNTADAVEVVVVDAASGDADTIEQEARPYRWVRVVHLDRPVGWAAARNAGLKTSRGSLIGLVDLSVEPTGDILTPLVEVFADDSVGVAGPFGLVTDDLREFAPSSGPDVHAIEGYLLVARRDSLRQDLISERFTWYRNADLDLSFQIRAEGRRAIVVDLPLVRHEHRGWSTLAPGERRRRSRRNHAIFYRRWKPSPELYAPHPRGA